MAFYVARRVVEDGVLTVALPGNVPWQLLAEFSDLSPLAIIACDLPEDAPIPDHLLPVAPELDVLLRSAAWYPPALALARNQLLSRHCGQVGDDSPQSIDGFQRELAELLQSHLDGQSAAPYLLARSVWEDAYQEQGAYYWLVAFDRQKDEVWWVSEDYFVYQDSLAAFAVTREQVERLPSPSLPQRGCVR